MISIAKSARQFSYEVAHGLKTSALNVLQQVREQKILRSTTAARLALQQSIRSVPDAENIIIVAGTIPRHGDQEEYLRVLGLSVSCSEAFGPYASGVRYEHDRSIIESSETVSCAMGGTVLALGRTAHLVFNRITTAQ